MSKTPRSQPSVAQGSRRWATWLTAAATPVLIAGASLALLFNPWWVLPAQQRAGVASITGFPQAEVERITTAIIRDVTLGPPDFAVAMDGAPVLGAAEAGHMRDVYGVLRAFGMLVLLAGATVVVLGARHRGDGWWWRAVGRAALVTAMVGAGTGLLFVAFFDAAWLAFHLVFFPEGNFSFDPKVERLTQLFPTAFWTDAAASVFVVGVVIAAAVWLGSRRVARRLDAV
ncbi:MAG: lipoprotein intramolecular transacylase Lit [Candidatus Limnocylindrales bacterium]